MQRDLQRPGLDQLEVIATNDSVDCCDSWENQMIAGPGRIVGLSIICAAMMTAATPTRDLSSYRRMQFGMNVTAAAKQAGMNATDARTVHQRPALIQELEWRPRLAEMTDPAKEGMLYFFNGELF